MSEQVTIDRIAAEFSGTVFWNDIYPYPGNNHDEMLPLEVLDPAPPAYCNEMDVVQPILIRFLSGELTVDIAQLPPQGEDADAGNVTSKADAHFIANLPVYIPAMLHEIQKLRDFKAYVHKRLDDAGVPVDPESPHKAEGCRIGGRLDWVLGKAAAPDLLEALRTAEDALVWYGEENAAPRNALKEIRAAIAKAKGKEPASAATRPA